MLPMPLLLVRHARAGRRSAWTGDDRVRPLTARGRAQAEDLVALLEGYRPQRILSSPYVRCCETVQPLAERLGLAVEAVDALAEGHGTDALALVRRMAGESAALCTHGDVTLEVLDALAGQRAAGERRALRLQKGEAWVIHSAGSSLAIVEHLRPGGREEEKTA